VDDVARVVAALCQALRLPVGVAHLSGPDELTRFDFARAAYRLAGADPGLVRPCLRGETEWASRPRYSSLVCDDFGAVPGLTGWRPMSPDDGLRSMLSNRARLGGVP
jgi:dTDP-4-dehydrorhamnose reductase